MRAPWPPWIALLALSIACSASKADDDDDDGEDGASDLDPAADEDGDGFTNAEEHAGGSDPLDAEDVPYAGGWKKGDCRDDIQPTGDAPGQVAADFALMDQFGEVVHLHDFCDRLVLVEFSGFT